MVFRNDVLSVALVLHVSVESAKAISILYLFLFLHNRYSYRHHIVIAVHLKLYTSFANMITDMYRRSGGCYVAKADIQPNLGRPVIANTGLQYTH